MIFLLINKYLMQFFSKVNKVSTVLGAYCIFNELCSYAWFRLQEALLYLFEFFI